MSINDDIEIMIDRAHHLASGETTWEKHINPEPDEIVRFNTMLLDIATEISDFSDVVTEASVSSYMSPLVTPVPPENADVETK